MVGEGFVTISDIAEALIEELVSIEGFDEDIASELIERAKNFVKIEAENIEKSLKMLEEANGLRSNDGYITDSLGWALYKLKKYKKMKIYLTLET